MEASFFIIVREDNNEDSGTHNTFEIIKRKCSSQIIFLQSFYIFYSRRTIKIRSGEHSCYGMPHDTSNVIHNLKGKTQTLFRCVC